MDMYRDVSSCNSHNYGDAEYWDARYVHEAGAGAFDWYQRYSGLRPFVRKHIPTSSRILMVGCGNALMSEDMVKDGYQDIVNIDISSIVIDMMRKKYEHIPQLKHLEMDVRSMSFFEDETFDGVIDKGTLDSLMVTYGDPTVRIPHLNRPDYNWKVTLYIISRPGFQRPGNCSSSTNSYLDPVHLTENGLLPRDFVLEDPDSHFVYVCKKIERLQLLTETI